MAIKGLTDRGLSFPELGQIRKGAKKEGNRPGADLSYFRVVFDEQETRAQADFVRLYGETPATIRVVLPFNEIERQWEAYLEGYTAGRMIARADGETFLYLLNWETGKLLVKDGIDIATGLPRPYVEGEPVGYYKNSKTNKLEPIFCKPSGRLRVILPELGRAAYLLVLTTSIHDILNISDQLRAFQTLNAGRIAGIPLLLRRRPKMISTPNQDGSRARRVKYLISIEADPEWVRAAIGEVQRLALPGGGTPFAPALSAPDAPDVIEGEVVDHDDDEIEGEYQDEHPEDEPISELGYNYNLLPEAVRLMKNSAGCLYIDLRSELLELLISDMDNYAKAHEMSEHQKAQYADKVSAAKSIIELRSQS